MFRVFFLGAANLLVAATVYFGTGASTAPAQIPMTVDARQGAALWQDRNCISCHSIYGLGGHLGPDLTNVIRRNGAEATGAIIQYGAGKMPAHRLTDAELDQLLAYLTHLDGSGDYPVKSFPDGYFGHFFEKVGRNHAAQ